MNTLETLAFSTKTETVVHDLHDVLHFHLHIIQAFLVDDA